MSCHLMLMRWLLMLRNDWRVAAGIYGLAAACLACGCQTGRDTPSSASAPPAEAPPVATGSPAGTTDPARAPDVLYVPTPEPVVARMLQLANVGPGDVVYDLGCGDGRIVVMAAQRYGAR